MMGPPGAPGNPSALSSMLTEAVARLRALTERHATRHEPGGSDAPRLVAQASRVVLLLKNGSGASVRRGDVVILSDAITTDRSFTTTTTLDDAHDKGVALEDIANTAFGMVALAGEVDELTVLSGVTRFQYLSTSATAGSARGTILPTPGSFAVALENRISATGKLRAVIGRYAKPVAVTGRATAQTGAVSSVAAYTVGSVDASFMVSANVLVTTATTHAFNVEVAYTDEGNTARVLTLNFTLVGGTFVTSVANGNGAVPYMGMPQHIRAKAATSITIRTQAAGSYTTVVYSVEGFITQIA